MRTLTQSNQFCGPALYAHRVLVYSEITSPPGQRAITVSPFTSMLYPIKSKASISIKVQSSATAPCLSFLGVMEHIAFHVDPCPGLWKLLHHYSK